MEDNYYYKFFRERPNARYLKERYRGILGLFKEFHNWTTKIISSAFEISEMTKLRPHTARS